MLRKVLNPAADVPAPFVHLSLGRVVDRSEGKFVQPAGYPALSIDVSGCLAGAHGYAEDGVLLQAHAGGKGRDLPVVNDGKGDFQFLTYVDEHRTDFFREIGIRNPPEEGGYAWSIINEDTGRTSAYGIEFGEVSLGLLNRVHDARPVVFRINLVVRVPRCFLAENDFSVDHCGNLAVASPEVESDPASFEVAAQWGG